MSRYHRATANTLLYLMTSERFSGVSSARVSKWPREAEGAQNSLERHERRDVDTDPDSAVGSQAQAGTTVGRRSSQRASA